MPRQLSLKKAKELSIIKWQWIVDHDGIFDRQQMKIDHPELQELLCSCGFCHRWKDEYGNLQCGKCELTLAHAGCHYVHGAFQKWAKTFDKKSAQDMLDIIKSIPLKIK